MQKRSQKLQSFAGQEEEFFSRKLVLVKKKYERSVKKWRKEGYVSRPWSEKSGNCRMAAHDSEDEIQILQAGEERRGRCASQANGCCFDPARVEQVFARGQAQTEHFIHAMQEDFNREVQGSSRSRANGRRRRERRLGRRLGR